MHSSHQLVFKALSEGAVKSPTSVKPRQLPLNLSVAAQRMNLKQTAHGVILNISRGHVLSFADFKNSTAVQKRGTSLR